MKYKLSRLSAYPAPVRIGIFTLLLMLLWLPLALPIYFLVSDRNTASILTLLILYAEFLWLVHFWGQQVYRQPDLIRQYGLEFNRRSGQELLFGLGLGVSSALFLFAIQLALGWLAWNPPTAVLVRVVLEGLLVSVAIGFAEELLFRGWLLDELQRDYMPTVVLWGGAIVFATLHFRLIVFPALVLLGVALIWAKRACWENRQGRLYYRLGLPIGLHAGLVWGNYIVEVGQLVTVTNRVPVWVTGVERNPLAGILGLLFLSGLAIGMWQFAIRRGKP